MDAGGRRTDTPGEAALIEAGPRDGGCRRERGDNNTFIIFLTLLFLLPSFTSLYLGKIISLFILFSTFIFGGQGLGMVMGSIPGGCNPN